jgi:hypothetical protein
MSDSYDVNGVTVTPLGGGFYELKHDSIEAEGNIEKVRGKEAADKRAEEIAAAAKPAEGQMQAQGDIDGVATTLVGQASQTPPAPPSIDALQAKADAADKNEADAAEKLKAEQDRSSALEAQLKEAQAQRDELLKNAEKMADTVTTIHETEGEKVEGRVPGGIPTAFTGELSKEAKAALKKAGLGYTKIILEENSDIPPTGLFVGHNGRGYMIQPGTPVDVPDFILGVLNDAKMSAPVTDQKSLKVLGYRERMKYPYRLAD